MNKNGRIYFYLTITVFVVLFLSGCAATVKNMRPLSPGEVVDIPEDGKAMVVFLRPYTFSGSAIQSSVFEVKENNFSLVGILATKNKVAYSLDPGPHLFMVIGESADFMSAELEPNKIYYVLVTPRLGWWKARFSLKPIPYNESNSSKLYEWLDNCEWVGKTDDSDRWAIHNMNSIKNKYSKYYKKWIQKVDKSKLYPQDGKSIKRELKNL